MPQQRISSTPTAARKRRNRARDQAASKASHAASAVSSQAHSAAGTVKGVAHAVTPHRHEDMDDATLADRVRSEIFRAADAPKGSVSVDVQAGVAYLRGEVAEPGLDRAPRQGRAQGPGHRRRQEPAAHAGHADADRRAALPEPQSSPLDLVALDVSCARVTVPGPRGEHEQQPRVAASP